jgi:hypothetical protein
VEFEIVQTEWAEEMEKGLQEYMERLWEGVDADFDDYPEDFFDTITGQAFCGCEVCVSREMLAFVTPRIIRAFQRGDVILLDES